MYKIRKLLSPLFHLVPRVGLSSSHSFSRDSFWDIIAIPPPSHPARKPPTASSRPISEWRETWKRRATEEGRLRLSPFCIKLGRLLCLERRLTLRPNKQAERERERERSQIFFLRGENSRPPTLGRKEATPRNSWRPSPGLPSFIKQGSHASYYTQRGKKIAYDMFSTCIYYRKGSNTSRRNNSRYIRQKSRFYSFW